MSAIRISTAFGVSLLTITLAAPLPRDTWSSFSTVLTQPIVAGSKELYVDDCRHIRVGGRVRISFATDEEEEGSVVGVECASASSSSSAAIAAAEQQQQQLAASAADCDISADAEELSDRCKQILQAALHVPGVADSYRAAAHSRGVAALSAASPKYQQQQQGALVPDSTGLPPAPNRRRIRGLAKLLGKVDEDAAAPVHAPGVITLSAGVLFGHSANVTLRGTEPMSEEESASACPTIQGVACSGRGSCEAGTDSCVCEAGSYGPACEHASACEAGCSAHGSCEGVGHCVCASGWTGHSCSEAVCDSDCSGRGSCVGGTCACHAGFVGETCSVHTASACPDSCNGHGNCARRPAPPFLLLLRGVLLPPPSLLFSFPLLTPPLFFTLSSHRRRRWQRRARLPLPLQVRWRLVHAGRDRLPIAPRLQLQWRMHEQPVDRRRHVRVL